MKKKETRGQPTALTSGNIRKQLVLSAVCFRYFGLGYWYCDTSCPIFWSKAIRTD